MNGYNFVADTNFIIQVQQGEDKTIPFLDSTPIVSVVSEIELLGWQKIAPAEIKLIKSFLSDCYIADLNTEIKDLAIDLRKNFKLKTPDAIIAATAKYFDLPLVTSDKAFDKVKSIKVILI